MSESADDASSTFHGEKGRVQLLGMGMDLFVAGTDTTTTMMEWITLYLASYPEAQASLRAEVESVCGGRGRAARPVDLRDRGDCPRVQSAIEESLRFSPMAVVNVPHRAQRDTHLGGYFFPKGTQVGAGRSLLMLVRGLLLQ